LGAVGLAVAVAVAVAVTEKVTVTVTVMEKVRCHLPRAKCQVRGMKMSLVT